MIKQCNKCLLQKPAESFHRSNTCRRCKQIKLNSEGLCQCGRELVNKTNCQQCRDTKRKSSKAIRARLKSAAMQAYGGCCIYCKEDRIVFLSIDHGNNDGASHRQQMHIGAKRGQGTGSDIYKWLKRNSYPTDIGLQVACYNCNGAKAIIGEIALIELRAKEYPAA